MAFCHRYTLLVAEDELPDMPVLKIKHALNELITSADPSVRVTDKGSAFALNSDPNPNCT